MTLPRPGSDYPVLLSAELSHSSLQSLTAFIPAERCLSLEPPTGLTSWTQLCYGQAGMSHPHPRRVPRGSSGHPWWAGLCPHHVPSTEIIGESPWLTGGQEEAGACGCSSSVRYQGLLPPPLWLLPQQHSRAVRDLLSHQTVAGIGVPRALSAQLPPSQSSSL